MRHSYLCGGDIRLEFFPGKGVACANVSVDGDFEDRPAAHCDADTLRAVVSGMRYHLAGPGWLLTLGRKGENIEMDLWRDGRPPKKCVVSLAAYESAVDLAFGSNVKAYAA